MLRKLNHEKKRHGMHRDTVLLLSVQPTTVVISLSISLALRKTQFSVAQKYINTACENSGVVLRVARVVPPIRRMIQLIDDSVFPRFLDRKLCDRLF